MIKKVSFDVPLFVLAVPGRGYVLASAGIAIGGLTDYVYFNTQMGLLFWLLGIVTMLSYKLDKYEVKR